MFALNLLRAEVGSGGFDRYFRDNGGDHALEALQDLDARLNDLEVDEPADDRIDAYIAARPAAFFR